LGAFKEREEAQLLDKMIFRSTKNKPEVAHLISGGLDLILRK
jgi:hypothetical protein